MGAYMMRPDKLDIAILGELRNNCRTTYNDIALKVGSNINTVAARIKKLEKDSFISGYATHIDYDKVGFDASAVLNLRLKSGNYLNAEALHGITSMPEVVMLCGLTGKHSLGLILRTRGFEDLIIKMADIGKEKCIETFETEMLIKEYKSYEEFNPFSQDKRKRGSPVPRRKPISELDLGILREIRYGANKPLRELSAVLDAPISTIKERMDRMEQEGIIKGYVADVNFPKLGYWGFGGVSIKLKGDKINDESVVRQLLEIPEVAGMYRTMGFFDLYAGVLTTGVDHTLQILKKISTNSGVQKVETRIALTEFKSFMQYNPLSSFRMEHER